jgi:hypothetical protein
MYDLGNLQNYEHHVQQIAMIDAWCEKFKDPNSALGGQMQQAEKGRELEAKEADLRC